MTCMKKIFFSLILAFTLFLIPSIASAQEVKTQNIYFFYSDSCPHCKEEKPFLGFLKEEYGDKLNIYAYEVSSKKSVEILQKIAPVVGLETGSVPITIVSDLLIVGYRDHESSGKPIKEKLDLCLAGETECSDVVTPLLTADELEIGKITFFNLIKSEKKEIKKLIAEYGSEDLKNKNSDIKGVTQNLSTDFSIPFLGQFDARNFSLPLLALIIGFLDGFNPCAMWVLLFLISLLLGLQDRRKMWLFGIVFILASAFVYFLFMTAWLNAFLFLGIVTWVRWAIALLAMGVGAYNLYDYYKHQDACSVTGGEKRQKTLENLKKLILEKSLIPALLGLVVLAFAVNLVELVCSAGFPAIFTSVLAMSDLPAWKYYFYILLYLIMFMIDDIIIFGLAMLTLESKLIGERYAKYSKIIGGVLMLIIGLLLILKPEWLMFG